MENILAWKDELATGFAEVDLQHKKLILIINDVNTALNSPKDAYAKVMAKALKRLTEYTYYHFEEEEKFMKMYEYPEFEKHSLEHKAFIEQVGKQIQTLSHAKPEDGFLFYRFLGTWLLNHIAISDQKWAAFISENQSKE